MASSSTTTYTSIPTPPTSCVYAEMRYGSNGSIGSPPELTLGHNGGSTTTGRITWDVSDNTFDSGQVDFILTIPPGGGSLHADTLSVANAITNPISYSQTTYGAISAVQIEAGVQINAAAAFSDLIVQFYKNGSLIETFTQSAGPSVDTSTASDPVAAQVLIVTPTNSDNDKVVITGKVQLQAPDGTFPDVDDIFAQIFVQTSSCS
jgi:hypothetical protein